MGREVKYKAWDKEEKVMIDWFWLNSEGKAYETPVTLYDTPHTEIERNDDLILMQYTGLKDKNGVEIYEGDVIAEEVGLDELNIIVEVVYYDGCFMGKEKGHEPEYPIKDFLDGEVVGNIYENPELLEENAE